MFMLLFQNKIQDLLLKVKKFTIRMMNIKKEKMKKKLKKIQMQFHVIQNQKLILKILFKNSNNKKEKKTI